MSKRRGEQVNWFDLPAAERADLMRGHGEIGRKYAGQVTQVIAGSVGLDDWEWGVSLFADDPLVFKKLIYEMRFDPASSRYALFGPFYVGIRFAPAALSASIAMATSSQAAATLSLPISSAPICRRSRVGSRPSPLIWTTWPA